MLLELLNIHLMCFLKIQTFMFQVVRYCSNSINCRLDTLTAQCKEKGKWKNCYIVGSGVRPPPFFVSPERDYVITDSVRSM